MMTKEKKYLDVMCNLSSATRDAMGFGFREPSRACLICNISDGKNRRFVEQTLAELDAKTQREYELANARIKREAERNLYLAAKEFIKAYEEYYSEEK